MVVVSCPNCGKKYVRRVRREGLLERLLSLASIYPFRCQLCSHRFRTRQPGVRYTRVYEDRRAYERIPVHIPATLIHQGSHAKGTAIDLSMAGCTLEIGANFRSGTILTVHLEPPHHASLSVEAVVIRSVRTKSIGLEFLRFEGDERDQLRSFVQNLLTQV